MTSNLENLNNGQNKALDEEILNTQEGDRFEMLSAYLDGEVTAAERKQIQQWLKEDPKIQELYGRLLKLRRQMQSMSFTCSQESANRISEQVFQRLDRRRWQQKLFWGGGAIAAIFIGVGSYVLTGGSFLTPKMATNRIEKPSPDSTIVSEPLMVVLNQPVVPIPKAVTSYQLPASNP